MGPHSGARAPADTRDDTCGHHRRGGAVKNVVDKFLNAKTASVSVGSLSPLAGVLELLVRLPRDLGAEHWAFTRVPNVRQICSIGGALELAAAVLLVGFDSVRPQAEGATVASRRAVNSSCMSYSVCRSIW